MSLRLVAFGSALAFGLLGCGSGTGPEGTGYVSVSLSGPASSVVSASSGLGAPAFDVVPIESIASMNVNVTAVEIHRVGAGGDESGGEAEGDGEGGDAGAEDGGPWIRIDLTAAGEEEVDVASLPEAGVVASGFQVAVEAVPAGTYNLLRLFFDGVSLSLLEDTMIDGVLHEANTDLPLEIRVPSGSQTGILVQTGAFEVPEGGTAGILVIFDAESSLKNVVLNNNRVSVTPVMTAEVQITQAPPEGAS
jgi:hypothetical protein